MKYYFAVLFLLFIYSSKGNKITLDNDVKRYEVNHFAKVFVDSSQQYNLDNILKQDQWSSITPELNGNKNPEFTYWITFDYSTPSSQSEQYLLEAFDPKINHLDIHVLNRNNKIKSTKLGNSLPFHFKSIEHKNLLISLPPTNNKTYTVVAKFKSEQVIKFRMVIRENESFINYALTEYIFIGLYIGAALFFIIFNLALFIKTKNRAFITLGLFAIFNLTFALSSNGIGFQYLWPNFPSLNDYMRNFSSMAMSILLLTYLSQLVDIRKSGKLTHLLLIGTITFIICYYFASLIRNDLHTNNLVEVIPYSVALFIVIKQFKKEASTYKPFLLGLLCLVSGYIIYFLWFNGYINTKDAKGSKILFVYTIEASTIIEMIFFSLAISKRIFLLDQEKKLAQQKQIEMLEENERLAQKVNRELEEKVQERTVQLNIQNEKLEDAYTELEKLNNQINQFNIQLDLENRKLTKGIDSAIKDRITQKEVSYEEFNQIFTTEVSCLKLLEQLKWGDGFQCIKCKNETYQEGSSKLSRRCTKCNYQESVTANTLFHRLRFSIRKAFYITYKVVYLDGKITVDKLNEPLEMRRTTTWAFKKKVEETMEILKKKSKKKKLDWEEILIFKK